jgi:hypothetical protein
MRRPPRIATATAAVLLVLIGAGCSRRMLTAPEPEPASLATDVTAPAPPSGRLAGPSILGTGITLPPILPLLAESWRLVTAQLVRVGEVTRVSGARYELQFASGSLSKDALITIQDYDSDILDVELGPEGTKFGEPVVLSIDFSGTRSDPGAAWYDHSEPVVYWLNETKNEWEVVPSTTDWASKKIHARLQHFSRYVVGGKAGWKGQPSREQD